MFRLIIMDIIRPGLDLQRSWQLAYTEAIIITTMVVIMGVIMVVIIL